MTRTLSTDVLTLDYAPEFGARVTALVDRRTGRDWLVGGAMRGEVSDRAVYLGEEARGWDECFPTVAPCTHPAWGGMRDHGALWGRPWQDDGRGAAWFETEGYRFARTLVPEGAAVHCRYELANTGAAPMLWMWSQHCLLDARPGERLVLEGVGAFDAADVPRAVARDGTVLKTYAPVHGQVSVGLTGPEGGIRFEWDAEETGFLGLWLDFGGWPETDPVHQLALEPTTAPADHLAAAGDAAALLRPGETQGWTVTLRLEAPGRDHQ